MTQTPSKFLKKSISLPETLWAEIDQTAADHYGGNRSRAIHDAWTRNNRYIRPSNGNKAPILGLFKIYRPALAADAEKLLEEKQIHQAKLFDRLLSALYVYLEHYDPERNTEDIHITDENEFTAALAKSVEIGTALHSNEAPAEYKAMRSIFKKLIQNTREPKHE